MTDDGPDAPLHDVLRAARTLGFLGPGPIEPHIAHGRRFAVAAGMTGAAPGAFLDLGAGGGVPGLILALEWPGSRGVLLDAAVRRTEFLRDACGTLGIEDRVRVVTARAEDAARDPDLRGAFELVVARSFAPPPVTAECAVGFLTVGGRLVVSEPPEDSDVRWPPDGVGRLGLRLARPGNATERFATLTLTEPCEERWPRRSGVPAKRPLW